MLCATPNDVKAEEYYDLCVDVDYEDGKLSMDTSEEYYEGWEEDEDDDWDEDEDE